MKPKIQLITRADDAGSCRSANEAILEGVEAKIIKNVSFMAVGPEIEHAFELLGGRDDICCGLHVTLNAEWEKVKWKPLRKSRVLVDENGDFLPSPQETKAQIEREVKASYTPSGSCFPEPADVEMELGREIEAQLQRLRELGLHISYVDEHMGVSWTSDDLRQNIANLCRFEQLIDAHSIPFLPDVEAKNHPLAALEKRFQRAILSPYVWVTHPGKIAPDMEHFSLKGQSPGEIARERDAERRLLIDPALPELLRKWKVKPCRYDEVLAPI